MNKVIQKAIEQCGISTMAVGNLINDKTKKPRGIYGNEKNDY